MEAQRSPRKQKSRKGRNAVSAAGFLCVQRSFLVFRQLILVKMILFKSCQAVSGSDGFVSSSLSSGRQQRSQNKASVTDQSGLQNGRRTSLPGQRKKGLFSVVSSTFYPLREALKSPTFLQLLSFLHLCPLLYCFTLHLLKYYLLHSLLTLHPLPTIIFCSPVPPSSSSLCLSSFFHLFSTLSFPLLTLSQIDFQLCVECLEASIFPNLTPIQPV